MLRYMKFDYNVNSYKKKYKIILLFSIILILIILIYNIIINDDLNNEIKIISRRIITDYNKQLELKGFKEKELQVLLELKGFKEVMIRRNAIEFLEKNYGIYQRDYNLDLFINNNNCVKKLIDLDTDLFTLLLNIDYDNLTVSFNYFNVNNDYNIYYNYNNYKLLANYYENIINNPIYKILKNKLEIDYNYNYEFNYYKNQMDYWFNHLSSLICIYNINNIIYVYDSYQLVYIEHIPINAIIYNYNKYSYKNYPFPYKIMCNINTSINTDVCVDSNYNHQCYNELYDEYEKNKLNRYSNLTESYRTIYTIYYNEYIKIYNEYEYIKKIINLEEIPIVNSIKF